MEQAAERRHYHAGEILCRKGDAGQACLILISGGAMVQLVDRFEGDHTRRIFLGPGQIVGEMSLLSGGPVTATVTAAVDTEAYVIPRPVFLELVDSEPGLRDALFGMLIDRMRHRETKIGQGEQAPCTMLVTPPGSPGCERLCEMLFRAVEHYAPGSVFVDTRRTASEGAAPVSEALADVLPPPEGPVRQPSTRGPTRVVTSGGPAWCVQLIERWRTGGDAGRALCIVLAGDVPPALVAQLHRSDLVLVLDASRETGANHHGSLDFGLASVDRVCLGDARGSGLDERWFFRVPEAEVESEPEATWDPTRRLTIDWLARRITGREIGLALGSGGSGGLAHFGVLQVLEEAGVTVDYVCGSSMGGVLALAYSKAGSARAATEMGHELISNNALVRDLTLTPRSGLLRGAKRREVAWKAVGDLTFAQLGKPTAVVAADLVRGERFVFEKGPTRLAMLATSAIPGIFPPESDGERLFVDGAVVSRVPADLLERRRCGLKIAVNVVPSTVHEQDDYSRLRGTFDRFFGLTNVIASSWGLLSGWHGAAEASLADILLEPQQPGRSGFDLGTIEDQIQAGREATVDKLDMILAAVSRLLRPGAP